MTTLTRPKVTFADLLWVAWRRNTTLIVVTAGLVAVAAVTMVVTGATTGGLTQGPYNSLTMAYYRLAWQPMYVTLLFGAAMGVFWGAPLVSREFEARTTLVAWGQDVPATRWLAGQVALLGAAATCLTAAVWLAMDFMITSVRTEGGGTVYQPFVAWFEVAPQLQIGYVLFGIALGVAAGALTRRTLPAMAITLFGFAVVRIVVLEWARAHFLPPVRTFEPWSANYQRQVPDNAMYVDSGYADANGVPMEYPSACTGVADTTACVKSHGVAGHYADFQPVERVDLFRWIETGIFVVLAVGLLVLAWWWLKRARRV